MILVNSFLERTVFKHILSRVKLRIHLDIAVIPFYLSLYVRDLLITQDVDLILKSLTLLLILN